jgi:hypothetical protein
MGKRERRRRRERAATVVLSPAAPVAGVEQLRLLVGRRHHLEQTVAALVDQLRAAGVGWPAIADALGVSRQAARQQALRRHKVQPRSAPNRN